MKYFQKTLGQYLLGTTKKILLVTIFTLGFTIQSTAQRDLLVTQAGEEIRCRILDETPTRFIYAYVGRNEKVLRSEIFKNLVTSFKYNFYDTDLVKSDKLPGNASRDGGKASRVDTRRNSSFAKDKEKKARANDLSKKESDNRVTDKRTEVTNKGRVLEPEKNNSKETVENVISPEVADALDLQKPISDLSIKEKRAIDKEVKKQEKLAEKESNTGNTIGNAGLLVEPQKENEFKNYLKFRVGVRGGISNIINNNLETANAYDLYKEKLNKGWSFGADAAYFITESFGIGGMFTNFMTSNKAEGLSYPNMVSQVNIDNGSIATKISNKFVGPVFYYRRAIDFKTFVVLGLSPGMNFYNEKGNYNGDNFDFKAKQFGGSASLGLDFLLGNDIIGRDIILSLEAGYNYSRYNDLDYGSMRGIETLATPMIMDRLDFSIGLRFMRFPKYLKLSSY